MSAPFVLMIARACEISRRAPLSSFIFSDSVIPSRVVPLNESPDNLVPLSDARERFVSVISSFVWLIEEKEESRKSECIMQQFEKKALSKEV